MTFIWAVCQELAEMYKLGTISFAHYNRAVLYAKAHWRQHDNMSVSEAASLFMELTYN